MKQISIGLIIILTVLLVASQFNADDTEFFSYYVTPDVWIILDTSGSMTWDMVGCPTYGDGSGVPADEYLGRDTDGDSLPNDSRMFIVKNALYSLVSDPDIDVRWGLASFYQADYSGSSDGQYRIPDSGTYPAWNICSPPWFAHSNPTMWWHTATKTYAYEAFFQRVQMAEGSPAHINEILRHVDNVQATAKKELHAQGGTPIACALRGVRYRYQDDIPPDNAKWCRGYYVILLTDGEPTYGIDQGTYNQGENALWSAYNGGSPLWMRQQCWWEAESLMNTYIPAFGPDPDTVLPIKTYVVGIGNVGPSTMDSIAKYGGTEHYYPATNADELQEALRAIVSDIINQATSYSGSEVTSIQEEFITSHYEARLYLCSFVPSWNPVWEGHMKAVKLVEGVWNIDSIPDSLVYWDAGDSLDARIANTRTIYTSENYALVAFDSSIAPARLAAATPGERDTIVRVVYTGTKKGITGYLGDIFHSTPLRIRGPNYFYEDDDFYLYREMQNNTRDPVLYAGANDGMLHCIDDSTGEERWAFIPEDLLPRLKNLMGEHNYYVDANVMAADIWYPTAASDSFKDHNEWKTVMFCGERQGGRAYSVLDVTDPDIAPDFLFKFDTTMANLGETWSHPIMFKIHKDSLARNHDRFFGFLGGGYWNDTLYDKYDPLTPDPPGSGFYMLDIVNMHKNALPLLGTDYWQIPPMLGFANDMHWPFPSQPTAIDTNFDTYFDILYIGDWAGQLWKVTINGDSSEVFVDDWEAEIIFKAPRPAAANEDYFWQPIFFPATTAWDGRRWWVFFGTGDRANASKEGTINRYYAIIDSTYSQPLTEADLKQTSALGPLTEAEIQGDVYDGWYFVFTDFDHTDSIGKRDGEKVTSFSSVLMDTLIFTTFQPYDQNNPCVSATGIARLYKVHYKKGSYNGVAPSRIVGSGLPQAPRYSFNISGSGMEIINLPGQVIVQPAPNLGIRRRLLWWFETK